MGNGRWSLRTGKENFGRNDKIDRANLEKYMSDFVDLQLKVQSKSGRNITEIKR